MKIFSPRKNSSNNRYSNQQQVLQPLICLLIPYLSYLVAESVHMSGILAIVLCGLMMKPYLAGNLSNQSLVTTRYFLKTLSTSCEAIIFVFLGLSTVSKKHDWDYIFITSTLLACFICRFIGGFATALARHHCEAIIFVFLGLSTVSKKHDWDYIFITSTLLACFICRFIGGRMFAGTYFLTYLANRGRQQKISLVDQFIMAYGGLRGAICYGLVMTLDKDAVLAKEMFVSTTVIVILSTVFLQDFTTGQLCETVKSGYLNHNAESPLAP
ncbi:unnamed protein product [Gongylonema pulchrum]|uniref:Na_H_Exchanger domain-containing protein n=1 Tax=Gongylonema pulchrum TaxID=637853 RepID=A0A183E0H3_9BILA|nr:unnamed protein product [Gongylonema pulchrum]